MTKPIHTFESSNTRHNIARILAALKTPQTYDELADAVSISHRSIRRYIKHLSAKPNRRVRVKSWRGNAPVIALGSAPDVARKPQTQADKDYKWRTKVEASEVLRERIQQHEKARCAIRKAKTAPNPWFGALPGVRLPSMNAEG